jgi:hypothetical protein
VQSAGTCFVQYETIDQSELQPDFDPWSWQEFRVRVLETKPRGQNLGTGRLGLRKTFAAADFFSWNDFA